MSQLAIASVPMQEYRELYDPATAFMRGTLFRELDKPWGVMEREARQG